MKHFQSPLAGNLSIITSQAISNYLPSFLPPLPHPAETSSSDLLINYCPYPADPPVHPPSIVSLLPGPLLQKKPRQSQLATQSHTVQDQLSVSTQITSLPSVFVDPSLFSARRKAVLQRVLGGNAANTLTHVPSKKRYKYQKRTETGLQFRQLSLHNLVLKHPRLGSSLRTRPVILVIPLHIYPIRSGNQSIVSSLV